MYYLCSENKDADQLRGYREADLRLCFRICKNPVLCYIVCKIVPSSGSIRRFIDSKMNDMEEFVRGEMMSLRKDVQADREVRERFMRTLISDMAELQRNQDYGMDNQNIMLQSLKDIFENQNLSMIEQAGWATQLQYIISQTIEKRNAPEEVSKRRDHLLIYIHISTASP